MKRRNGRSVGAPLGWPDCSLDQVSREAGLPSDGAPPR